MHVKYKVSISYGSKVIAKVKVDNRQTDKQTDRQTDKQTGQKQYAPNHSIRGHKNCINIFYIYNITTYTNYLTYVFMYTGKQLIFVFQNYFGDKKYVYKYLTNLKYL